MKKILLSVLFVLMLFGCGKRTDYGSYDFSVCSPSFYVEDHAIITDKTIVIDRAQTGPNDFNNINNVATFVDVEKGMRVYIDKNDVKVYLVLQDGKLSGYAEVDGQKVAILSGRKDIADNLKNYGQKDFEVCKELVN